MNAIILTGHGRFSEGVFSALSLVIGRQKNVTFVNFLENDGTNALDEKLLKAIETFKSYENILILADLLGGTPFNRAVLLTKDMKNVRVISGCNFQMAYAAVFESESDIDAAVKNITAEAVESIMVFTADAYDANDDEEKPSCSTPPNALLSCADFKSISSSLEEANKKVEAAQKEIASIVSLLKSKFPAGEEEDEGI